MVLLYYLSQNPDFTESAKPLMEKLKDSQQMLSFLGDLSRFTQTFSAVNPDQNTKKQDHNEQKQEQQGKKEAPPPKDEEQPSASPTSGIADEFIQNILDSYLKKR